MNKNAVERAFCGFKNYVIHDGRVMGWDNVSACRGQRPVSPPSDDTCVAGAVMRIAMNETNSFQKYIPDEWRCTVRGNGVVFLSLGLYCCYSVSVSDAPPQPICHARLHPITGVKSSFPCTMAQGQEYSLM